MDYYYYYYYYYELANKASSYAFLSETSSVFYFGCIIFIILFALASILFLLVREFGDFTTACMGGLLFCVIFLLYSNPDSEDARKLDELVKLANDNNIDSLANLIDNVDYLSDRYSEKLDTFKIMHRDNVPSKKEYVNNILTKFYSEESISGDFDYSTEYEEAVEHLK